jgi:hypothetical protein
MTHIEGVDDGHGYGVRGRSPSSGHGVRGLTGNAVFDPNVDKNNVGVFGKSDDGMGVLGMSQFGLGVFGWGTNDSGVFGYSESGHGVSGHSFDGNAIYGHSTNGQAAYLDGRVSIRGPLSKPGGSFKIDHPLDPANKYLCHSFVESPDMKNVYDGVVALDNKGEVEISLPDWFAALNKDFRYQLTAIGAPGPNLYIAEEISDKTRSNNNNSSFRIAGGTSGMKVS